MENHFNPSKNHSTMSNIVFLLLSLFLGICYFTITVVGISLGVGTVVIWIGLPILFVTLLVIRGMAEIERRMVSSLLHLPIHYQLPEPNKPGMSFLRHFGKILTDPYTWTSMVYMLLKLPLGILSFTLVVTFSVVSFTLALFPLGYLISLLVNVILLRNGVSSDGSMIPGFIEVHGSFDVVMFARSFIGVPVGIGLWFVTRYILNTLALVSGELARALLGPGVAYVTAQPHTGYASSAQREEQPIYQEQRLSRG